MRSKAFHDVSYGNLEDAGGLDDHVAGLKQLAAGRPYMDLDRVGVYGFSGGGYMSTHAILTRPNVYKVAVSGAGNHDQRGYIALWGEKYHGLMDTDGANYVQQANVTHAAGLEAKLLLIHGEMDDNVSPALTLQLVDALIKANRDFDMLIMPNLNHGAAVDAGAADRSLPLGIPLPGTLVGTAKLLAELRYDFDFDDLNYLDRAAEIEVPILVIHGTDDGTVPIDIAPLFNP